MNCDFPTRLGWGKGFRGPDYPGCINSGAAPAILKSRTADRFLGKPFVVGGEFCLRYAMYECVSAAMAGRKTRDMKRFKVRFFKTYSGAKSYFLTLLADIVSEREKARAAVAAVKAAKPGSPEQVNALLAASDYGMV